MFLLIKSNYLVKTFPEEGTPFMKAVAVLKVTSYVG